MQTKTKAANPLFREGHRMSLLLSVEEAGDQFVPGGTSLRVHLSVITVTPEGSPRNVWSLDEYHNGLMVGCLQIKGTGFSNRIYDDQGNKTDDHRRSFDAHGFRVLYQQPYSVDLKEAEVLVKTLRTVERRLDAARERDGAPADFPAFVRRAARALGIDLITFPTEPNQSSRYDQGSYRTLPLEGGLYHLETVIRAWERKDTVPGVVHHTR